MKKFDLKGVKGVFSNLRGNEKSSNKGECDVQESLQSHDFYCGKLTRHGFPYQPTCMAWDPIQKLLAVGTKHGVVRLLGKPGVDLVLQHEGEPIVIRITFLVNEGAFITACSDDSVNLWSYRQKTPEIVHSLKFSRERITCLHLPFQSKWLYVGTERGNVHIVNVETFTICGYTINWNKAIELSRKTHPGPVVRLSDNPMDSNKLLIGFETGLVVCWDLKCKMAEFRFNSTESLRDACWHQEGKLFMCSYADGTLSTWNFKQQTKPISVMTPHSKASKNGSISPCKPINRVEWKTVKGGEPYVIFSGGMSYEGSKSPCLTIMHGKSVTVLEMEHKILDFIVLCKNLWSYDYDEPYAIVVLLARDLIFVDMTTPGYPCFQCPYSLDIHESPVTCLKYISDCASDLIPAIYSCGTKQKRKGFSPKEFPVSGGEASTVSCSYTEMLVSGHADGSIKFWDVSGTSMQFLYRMKTSKQFEKVKRRESDEEDVLAIQHIYLDEESRLLALAATHHILLYNYSKKEVTSETPVVEVTAVSDLFEESNESPTTPLRNSHYPNNGLSEGAGEGGLKSNLDSVREMKSAVKAKTGAKKHAIGYQPELAVILQWCDGATPPIITCICVNSSYGMLAAGTTNSIFIIDTVQKSCVLNVVPSDLCNSEVGRLASHNVKSRLHSASSTEQENVRSPDLSGEGNSKGVEQRSSPDCDERQPVIFEVQQPSPEVDGLDNLDGDLIGRNKSLSCQSLSSSSLTSNNNSHQPLSKTLSGDDKPAGLGRPCATEPGPLHQKTSWTRRLSAKMGHMTGLSIHRSKPLNHTSSQSALTIGSNSTGFFSDQRSVKKAKPDKPDGMFSRSRSPSTSSLDIASTSDVQFLMFADSYSRKQSEGKSLWSKVAKAALAKSKSHDTLESAPNAALNPLNRWTETMSSLWIGTSTGTLMALDVIPYYSERSTKPVMVAHSGTTFQLKGTILDLCFLNYKGVFVPVEAEMWGDTKDSASKKGKGLVSRVSRLSASSTDGLEKAPAAEQQHIAVVCSDSEVRSISLPSQNVLYKEKFADGMFVAKAQSIIFKESACMACLGSNGNLMIYSLPSLRQLLNYNYFGQLHIRILRTLEFSNHGHAMYMCSANEIQKITVSAEMCRAQPDMECEPFLAKENPEPPKQNFLKSLFSSGPSPFDREELFGSAGKASHGIATLIPGAALRGAQANASGLAGDMARTRMALDERGEKLGRLDERTEALRERAREFSNNAASIADRYKNLKWYQF